MEIKSISPNEWGPPAWKFIHYIALAYPNNPSQDDKNNYENFFVSLQNVLPCNKCKENYKKHLQIFPLKESLDDNKSLFKWSVDIHNEVNRLNNKNIFTLEQAYDEYLHKHKNYKDYLIVFSIVTLIALILIYLKYHK